MHLRFLKTIIASSETYNPRKPYFFRIGLDPKNPYFFHIGRDNLYDFFTLPSRSELLPMYKVFRLPVRKMLTNDEIQEFLAENAAKNTKRKTENDINTFYRWIKENLPSETRKMEEIPPPQLNQILRTFFVKIRKQNGRQYEPDSIKAMQNSFDRYLAEKDFDVSLLKGHEFKGSRVVLTAKCKQIKHEGYGRKPNRAQSLTEEEEEVLWSTGQLGMHNARSLQNAVWWRNNFFGMRGRKEHRDMKWGDIIIQTDTDGLQYLEYRERDTKTRKDPSQERAFIPRIYATPGTPDKCPVNLLILFTHKRPTAMLDPESPFYLSILNDNQMKQHTWYKKSPLGKHSLGEIMKTMCTDAGLTRLTNHSGRKTTVKRLREADIESFDIIQLTGHKNIQSVNSYSDVSLNKQKQMSKILVQSNKPLVEQTTPFTATTATISSEVSSTPHISTMSGPCNQYDFDPEDGFDDVIAQIEDYELQNLPPVAKSQYRSDFSITVMPQASFTSCTFNFTLNFTR